MLFSEELPRDLGAHLRPKCRRRKLVSPLSGRRLSRGHSLRHLDPERAGLGGVDLERRTQPGRCPNTCIGQISSAQLLQSRCGERMHASAEQSPHLLRGHHIPGAQTINAGNARADP